MSTLAEQRALHDDIEALYGKFNEERVYFRRADPPRLPTSLTHLRSKLSAPRDRAVCGLLNKAAATKASVVTLCDEGFGDDAYTLCRVLCENAVVLAWVLDGDWVRKLDAYCLYGEAVRTTVVERFGKDPDLREFAEAIPFHESSRQIAERYFGKYWKAWAPREGDLENPSDPSTFAQMCEDITAPGPDGKKRSVFKEVTYWDMSFHVHSSPPSIWGLMKQTLEQPRYSLSVIKTDERTLLAMGVGNWAMLLALQAVTEWLGLALVADVKRLQEQLGSAATALIAESP